MPRASTACDCRRGWVQVIEDVFTDGLPVWIPCPKCRRGELKRTMMRKQGKKFRRNLPK